MKGEHIIRYERMGQLISIAASKQNRLHLDDLMLDNQDTTFTVSFTDYIKSQIHLNLVTGLYDRDIFDYKFALDYINGKSFDKEPVRRVQRYYYQDMLNFLANNKYDCDLNVLTDIEGFNNTDIIPSDVSSEFSTFIDSISKGTFDERYQIIKDSKFAELIDYVDDYKVFYEKMYSSKTMAFLLLLLKGVSDGNYNS